MTNDDSAARAQVLEQVMDAANTRRDGRLPRDVDGVQDAYPSDLMLVEDLRATWRVRLGAEIDHALADDPVDVPSTVVAAWRRAAEAMPGVRAVLDHALEVDDAAVVLTQVKAVEEERAWLADVAGLAESTDRTAPGVGADLEAQARGLGPAADSILAELDISNSLTSRLVTSQSNGRTHAA